VIGNNNKITLIFKNDQQLSVPFLAPPRSTKLIGRQELFFDLKERLFARDSLGLFALNGLPGVGKTALALALAHDISVLGYFHDGVLWARLGRQPDVLSILGTWGIALGISSEKLAALDNIRERATAVH